MTHNNYTIKKNINENTFFNDIFDNLTFAVNDTPNYSEALDNLILASVTDKNPYMKKLNKTKSTKDKIIGFFTGKKSAKKATKIETLLDAIHYLAHDYTPEDAPFSTDYIKIELKDGTILRIFDDEIQIDDVLLSLDDSAALMEVLSPKKQKLIIDFAIHIAA